VQFPLVSSGLGAGSMNILERAKERLKVVIPLTLLIVFILLYFNTAHVGKVFIVSWPFLFPDRRLLVYLPSWVPSQRAVWVGIIALAGS